MRLSGARLRVAAVHPDPCVDAAHAIQKQHRAEQAGYRVGSTWRQSAAASSRSRLSSVLDSPSVPPQVFAERAPVTGIRGGSTVKVRNWRGRYGQPRCTRPASLRRGPITGSGTR
jgi:uncharacterized protein (DUF736 family)